MSLFLRTAILAFVLMASAVTAQNVRFMGGDTARDIPFRIASNLVLVEVSVGKAPKGWFIFDTGAESTVVDTKYAAAAGLKISGKTVGTGSAGTAVVGVMNGASLKLAGVEATDLTVYGLPLEGFSADFGMKIAGILGNDVIAKTVVELDYANQKLTLYSPSAFRPPKQVETLPMTIEEHLPFIRAGIIVAGRTIDAKMEIDTGSTGAVLFNGPFVRKNRLIAGLGRSLASRTGGVGGTGTSRVGRVTGIQLGKAMIHEPLAVLYTGTKGDNASRKYDGLLGGPIFRRFKMTIDIPGRRLFLEPASSVDEPFETDMSGMDLVADGVDLSKILVDDVKPASVAARAGVRGDEFIRAVNGRPVSELGIEGVRRILKTPGEVEVELERGRRLFTVRLVLKRVI